MKTSFLFVYGTLRKGYAHPLSEKLSRRAEYMGGFYARGKLYIVPASFDGEAFFYPAFVTSENVTDRVVGDVYKLSNTSLLDELDVYEGCSPSAPTPHEYKRKLMQVYSEQTEKSLDAWVYFYNRSMEGLEEISSGDFFSIIRE